MLQQRLDLGLGSYACAEVAALGASCDVPGPVWRACGATRIP